MASPFRRPRIHAPIVPSAGAEPGAAPGASAARGHAAAVGRAPGAGAAAAVGAAPGAPAARAHATARGRAPGAPAARAHAAAVGAAPGAPAARAHAAIVAPTPGAAAARAHPTVPKARFDEVWNAALRAIQEMHDAAKKLKDMAASNYVQSASHDLEYVHIGALFDACNKAEDVARFLETASHDFEYALCGPLSPPSDISEFGEDHSDDDLLDDLSHFEEMGLDIDQILDRRM